MWGKFPLDFDDKSLKINIFDKKTRLFSKDVIILLKVLLNKNENSNYFLNFILVGIILLIIIIVLLKLFVKNRPKINDVISSQ